MNLKGHQLKDYGDLEATIIALVRKNKKRRTKNVMMDEEDRPSGSFHIAHHSYHTLSNDDVEEVKKHPPQQEKPKP